MNLFCLVTLIALCSVASAQYTQPWTSVIDFANTTGIVHSVARTRAGVAIGGDFSFATPSGPAKHFVFVHLNGTVLTYDVDAPVYSIKTDFLCTRFQRQIFIGGDFKKWNSQSVRGLAALDLDTFTVGELTQNPYIIGKVRAVGFNGYYGTNLYIGGLFQFVNTGIPSANCTLGRYNPDGTWTCSLDTSNFNQVNAVFVTSDSRPSVIAVGDPATKIATQKNGGSWTWTTQSGVSGASYSIGYSNQYETGPLFVGGDNFLYRWNANFPSLSSQTTIGNISGTVYTTYVTSSSDYKPDTLYFGGSFVGRPNGYDNSPFPIYANALQTYNIKTGVLTSDKISASWFADGTVIKDIDFPTFLNPDFYYVVGNFARVGAINKTRNVATISTAPMPKSTSTVCLITEGLDSSAWIITNVTLSLQKGFTNVVQKNMTSTSVASDFSDCPSAIVVGDPLKPLGYTAFGDAMLTRVKQGMKLVLTQAAMSVDVAMFGSSTFVSEAMCTGVTSFVLFTNFQNVVPSPLMSGIEFFWNLWTQDAPMISNANNTLYATLNTGSPTPPAAVCTRKVANNAGGSTLVVQLNVVPLPNGWSNGNYDQLMIQALNL